MSNTFINELQQAVKEVYTELEAKELIQENIEKAAKLGVYYAHGATDKAADKLENDQEKAQKTAIQLSEATDATEICGNIVTAATAAATDARNTNSAASTAAVNIQAAANALTDLSADVAAILAVATAKDCGSKIQKLANNANLITRSAAKKAENTTLQSLNTTIEAAQSRAAVSLSQAKTLETDIKSLNKVLDTNFEALQTKISADSALLTEAIATENDHNGIYKTALQEEKAMQFSEEFINKKVNYDLKYVKVGTLGEQFEVSFMPFDTIRQVMDNGELKEENVLKEYRIIFTTLDDAPGFDIHAAKATPKGNYRPFIPALPIIPINPTTPIPLTPALYTIPFSIAERGPRSTNVAIDYTGQAVKRGVPYAVFVYVEYTCPYQSEMDNTDGFLSLPSLPFTLQTDLPDARKPRLHFYQNKTEKGDSCSTSNAVRVTFTVDKLMYHKVDMAELADFRVFLFRKEDQLSSTLNHLTDKQLTELFKLDEAYRISEQCFLEAQQAYKTAIATGGDTATTKKAMEEANDDYEEKTTAYNKQLAIVEVLNQAKVSNFFLDRDILKSIPVAFRIKSNQVTPAFIEQLLGKLDLKKAEQEGLRLEIDELNQTEAALEIDLATKQGEITANNTALAEAESDAEVLRDEILLGLAEEYTLELLLKEMEGKPQTEARVILEGLIVAAGIAIADDIKNKLLQLNDDLAAILVLKTTGKTLVQAEIQIAIQIIETTALIAELNEQIQGLEKEIEFLTEEYEELASDEDATEFESLTEQIEAKKEKIKDMKKANATAAEIKVETDALKDLKKQLKALEDDIEKKATEGSARKFVAINEDGDFTDNYGEPLMHDHAYTAMVFSVIKATEPEAIPLFRTSFSPFSDDVKYELPQV